jgi:hypothetical protein
MSNATAPTTEADIRRDERELIALALDMRSVARHDHGHDHANRLPAGPHRRG